MVGKQITLPRIVTLGFEISLRGPRITIEEVPSSSKLASPSGCFRCCGVEQDFSSEEEQPGSQKFWVRAEDSIRSFKVLC